MSYHERGREQIGVLGLRVTRVCHQLVLPKLYEKSAKRESCQLRLECQGGWLGLGFHLSLHRTEGDADLVAKRMLYGSKTFFEDKAGEHSLVVRKIPERGGYRLQLLLQAIMAACRSRFRSNQVPHRDSTTQHGTR